MLDMTWLIIWARIYFEEVSEVFTRVCERIFQNPGTALGRTAMWKWENHNYFPFGDKLIPSLLYVDLEIKSKIEKKTEARELEEMFSISVLSMNY